MTLEEKSKKYCLSQGLNSQPLSEAKKLCIFLAIFSTKLPSAHGKKRIIITWSSGAGDGTCPFGAGDGTLELKELE